MFTEKMTFEERLGGEGLIHMEITQGRTLFLNINFPK